MSSLLMVVAGMVEFAAVMILKFKFAKKDTQTPTNAVRPNDSKLAWRANKSSDSVTFEKTIHDKIDDISFVLFPITYLLFNVIYFVYYSQI